MIPIDQKTTGIWQRETNRRQSKSGRKSIPEERWGEEGKGENGTTQKPRFKTIREDSGNTSNGAGIMRMGRGGLLRRENARISSRKTGK